MRHDGVTVHDRMAADPIGAPVLETAPMARRRGGISYRQIDAEVWLARGQSDRDKLKKDCDKYAQR